MIARPRRSVVVVTALAAFGALFVAATRTWVRASLVGAAGGERTLDVAGAAAAPVVTACALTGLAGAAALSIAGRRTRGAVLAVLVLTAVGAGASALQVVRDPFAAVRVQVADAVAVTPDSLQPGAADVRVTAAVWVAVAACAGAAAVAAAGVLAAPSWRPGDRFAAPAPPDGPGALPRPAPAAPAEGDAAASWDALTRGTDPTGDPAAADRAGGASRGVEAPAGGRMDGDRHTDGGTPHG